MRIKKERKFSPMLASKAGDEIKFPIYASPKLDGIRAIIKDGVVLSRTLKPIPNKYIQEVLGKPAYNRLDGELIVGESYHPNVMQATTSGVMSIEGEPEFIYFVFDRWSEDPYVHTPFHERYRMLCNDMDYVDTPNIRVLEQTLVKEESHLLRLEEEFLAKGWEGVMIRSVNGIYKHGRSTNKEGYLLKLKRFSDAEAYVVGVEELLHNDNEAVRNSLGLLERSTHMENKRKSGMLGSLVCRDIETGIEFNIGTGISEAQRKEFWDTQESIIGRVVKYKYFPVGVKEKPRFPVFLGWRNKIDI